MIQGLINVDSYLESYNNPPIHIEGETIEQRRAIQHALELLDLPFDDTLRLKLKKHILTDDTSAIFRAIAAYNVKLRGVDYNSLWFKWLKNKIDEFYFRYTRKKIPYTLNRGEGNNNLAIYKSVFLLYMQIYMYTSIFDYATDEKGKALDYFITAQLSAMYDARKGILGTVTEKIFTYDTNIANYNDFIKFNYRLDLIGGYHKYYFMDAVKKVKSRSLYLADHESSVYRDNVVPILQLRLPKLTTKNSMQLTDYLRTLEFAMYRERLKDRFHNAFILSIEHLRTFTQLYKTVKRGLTL